MKNVQITLIACLFSASIFAPVNANSVSELTTQALQQHLIEIQESIKTQTKSTIEQATKQLLEQTNISMRTTKSDTGDTGDTASLHAVPKVQATQLVVQVKTEEE
ncbi:hypothetical protein [Alishewanella tabrizica]|uniref:Uncharacterized protein n=1 Tax=Alishewanella tabrizica TaxID=671278 RepID=A0ABQ2WUE8_9ALTE|nr:hypothetical protein [Alishewanella tabrizica]GGW71457.1 hypothetical protein GCM10008111_29340 [Alishewanella tabrizica]